MRTAWRRPPRPFWLGLAIFWLAYLVLALVWRNWLLASMGCLQLALAAGFAWDARWTRWTPGWWPRRHEDEPAT